MVAVVSAFLRLVLAGAGVGFMAALGGMVPAAAGQSLVLTDDEVCDLIPPVEANPGGLYYEQGVYQPGGEGGVGTIASCGYLVNPTPDQLLRVSLILFEDVLAAQDHLVFLATGGVMTEEAGAPQAIDLGDEAAAWAWVPPWDLARRLYETHVRVGPFVVRVSGNNIEATPAAATVAAGLVGLVGPEPTVPIEPTVPVEPTVPIEPTVPDGTTTGGGSDGISTGAVVAAVVIGTIAAVAVTAVAVSAISARGATAAAEVAGAAATSSLPTPAAASVSSLPPLDEPAPPASSLPPPAQTPPAAATPPSRPPITDAEIFAPDAAPGDVAIVNGGPGAQVGTAFTGGDGSPGRCAVFGLPRYSVNTASRNLVVEDTIYAWSGRGPAVALTLTHNSSAGAGRLFGGHWHFSYESHLALRDGLVDAWGGDGRTARFEVTGRAGTVRSLEGEHRLHTHAEGWELLGPDGLVRSFRLCGDGAARLTAVTDPAGNTVRVDHDAAGNLTAVTDAVGRTVRLELDDLGRCTALALPDGRRATFSFDAVGRLAVVTDLAGIDTRYEYDAEGRITTMAVDAGRLVHRFAYATDDHRGAIAAVTDAAGGVTRYELVGSAPRTVAMTDPTGRVTRYESQAGLTTRVSTPSGASTVVEVTGRVPTSVHRGDAVDRVEVDTTARRVRHLDAVGGIREVVLDDHGRVVATGPSDAPTRISYDDASAVVVRSPAGHVTTAAFDEHGDLRSVRDPEGGMRSLERDRFGNVTATTDPTGAVTRFEWDEAGFRITAVTDPTGATTRLRHDANDRPVEIVHPDGTRIAFEYSCCAGTRTVDEDGRARTARRDALLRVLGVADGIGNAATTTWDAAGRRTSWSDRSGRVWHCTHDEDGRPHTVTDPLGHELRFEHDTSGRLVGVVDRRGNRTRYAYDATGRLIHTVRPSGLADTVEYTDRHLVRRVTDRRGQVTEFEHDADGAVVAISGTDRAPVRFGYDAAGRLVSMTDDRGSTVWERDPAGRVVAETGPDGLTVRFGHTATGELATITLPDGATITSTHDDRGRLAAAVWPGGGIRFDYDPVGRLTGEHRSNGIDSAYEYDSVGALARIRHAGAEVLADLSYRRDAAGRVVEAWGVEPLAPAPSPAVVEAEFGASDEVVALGGVPWQHDEAGNVVRIGDELTLAYDPDGRLRRVDTAAGREELVHDGLGRCVERRGPDGAVRLLHDPFGRVIAELDASGALRRAVVHRDDRVAAWFGPDGSRFPLGDQAGNVVAVTDEHQARVAAYAYTPSGEVVGFDGPEAGATPFRFAGLYGVRTVGDHLAMTTWRAYHPATGRFLQPDPLGLLGGPNLYVYAANDPVNLADPHGAAGQPHVSMSENTWWNRWGRQVWESMEGGPYRGPETTGVYGSGHWAPDWQVTRVLSEAADYARDVLRTPQGWQLPSPPQFPSGEEIQAWTMAEYEELLRRGTNALHAVPGGSTFLTGMNIIAHSPEELARGDYWPTVVRIADAVRTPLAGWFAPGIVHTANWITDRLVAAADLLSTTEPRRGGCPPP